MFKLYEKIMLSNTESWQYFVELREFWNEKCGIFEGLSQFVKEKQELDRAYGKGIEKLCRLPLFDYKSGSFGQTIQSIQMSLQDISSNFLSHCEFIQEDLLRFIKNTKDSHEASIKEIRTKTKSLINEREKMLKKLEYRKNKYLKCTKENEMYVQDSKVNTELSTLDNYLAALHNLNTFNAIFRSEISEPLQRFKEKITEKLETAKKICQNLVSSEASCIYTMKMHLDKLAVLVEQTNFDIEMKKVETLIKKGTEIANESFVSKATQNPSPQPIHDLALCIHDEDLSKIVHSCWQGSHLPSYLNEVFQAKISTSEGKKGFIQILNEKRKIAEFLVPGEGFKSLVALFRLTLDSVQANKNFPVTRQCIILSQTFYNESHEFVQQSITDHPLWSIEGYWDTLVIESILYEVQQANEAACIESNRKESEQRNKEVIISTLIAYMDIMNSFNKGIKLIETVLNKCKIKFSLLDEDIPYSFIIGLAN